MLSGVATASQYETLYTELRARIERGEFAVGDRLPSISTLQEQYDIHSLGTVRAAQQLLVEDGMIRTEQGRGAFVTSIESARTIDPGDALNDAIAQVRRAQAALARQQVRRVIETVRAERIPAVFSESTVSAAPAEQVARESGARYGGVLYVDSLSAAEGPVPTYLDLLRVTTETLVKGLAP